MALYAFECIGTIDSKLAEIEGHSKKSIEIDIRFDDKVLDTDLEITIIHTYTYGYR